MPETSDNTVKETRSIKPYNILMLCFGDGYTLKTVDNVHIYLIGTECGYHA